MLAAVDGCVDPGNNAALTYTGRGIDMERVPRPLRWFVPSREEIRGVPDDVKKEIGFKLRRLQNREDELDKDIKRFGEDRRISHLTKIVVNGDDGNTYRAVATVEFSEGIWMLGVFEKRASSGISTPKKDIDRIADRLKRLKEFRNTPDGLKMRREMEAETEARRRQMEAARRPRGG
jgi:phage-related protein